MSLSGSVISSPRHRRSIKDAVAYLDQEIKLPARQRRKAIERISLAQRPRTEAKRIIRARHKEVADEIEQPDLSDVQELRAWLIRRDKGIWSPHSDYLKRMELIILTGKMDRETFVRMAATVKKKMPQSLPRWFRIQEWEADRKQERQTTA